MLTKIYSMGVSSAIHMQCDEKTKQEKGDEKLYLPLQPEAREQDSIELEHDNT